MDLLKEPDLPEAARPESELLRELGPLLSAEAAAEAPAAGVEAADLEQAVWVRLLERGPHAPDPGGRARWLRRAVRAEARLARRRTRREVPYGAAPTPAAPAGEPEDALLHGEENRALRSAVARLPGRCPQLIGALLSPRDLTYREIAGELGISQGSLGPVRSRCLGCLRRMLAAEVAAPGPWGKER
ncbi:RNA polymerase sigma factor [Streptomyces lavendulae subsp. lavendulae]|uniref:sigma-70 family RNA polymerase sigma factor n=1 Tax=Streptomyces lavendulae TaxID=1914 RepID=UPI0024A26D57|nr:sigma-70 family RNA polymerase sigma factor [Streptomyces lavendulae]GLV84082.1 RNA polymerase sigma factor [Streptomyces lavendulae subsp. lavendulae]